MFWNGVNLSPLNRYRLICCQISLGSSRVTLMFTLPSINLAAQKITPLSFYPRWKKHYILRRSTSKHCFVSSFLPLTISKEKEGRGGAGIERAKNVMGITYPRWQMTTWQFILDEEPKLMSLRGSFSADLFDNKILFIRFL